MKSEKILTKLCYKLIEGDYLDKNGKVKDDLKFKISIPELGIINSKIPAKEDEKFDTYLFLPEGEGRKGEGGLRTKGYFKFNYIRNKEDNKWWISDFRGNPLIPAPEEIQQQINSYMAENKDLNVLNIEQLPLITVITVVLNGEKYLEETIQSVINQTYPNVEYIIIDGGSTDGTLDIIKKYENYIDYWVSEKDRGIYEAMNKGIIVSNGTWLGFLGSDDFYELDAMRSFYLFLLNENCDVLYGNTNVLFNNDIVYRRVSSDNINDILKEFIFFHPDSISKKIIYKKIGLYNTNFKLAADYEFFLRAYFNGFKFSKIDKTILNYRLQGYSSNYKIAFREKIEIYKLYRDKLGFNFLLNSFYQFIKAWIKDKLNIKEDSFLLKFYRKFKYEYKRRFLQSLVKKIKDLC